jgi:hypothetical protein
VKVPKPTGGHWHGVVEKILLDNYCKLSEVKRKRKKWVKTNKNENWAEPFDIIRIVTLPNPKKKPPKKKRAANTVVSGSAPVPASASTVGAETAATQVGAFFDELIAMEPRFKAPLINAQKKCQKHHIEDLYILKKITEDDWNQLILKIGVRQYVREMVKNFDIQSSAHETDKLDISSLSRVIRFRFMGNDMKEILQRKAEDMAYMQNI